MPEKKVNVFGLPSEPDEQAQPVFQTPPPAQATPGITGNPPLPPGQPVRMVVPNKGGGLTEADYLPEELATLNTIPGWTVGDPVPPDLAATLEEVSHDSRAAATDPDMPLPIGIDTPPLKIPESVDVSQLPPEKQQEIMASLEQARAHREAVAAGSNIVEGAGQGVNEAIQGAGVRDIELVDDLASPTYANTGVPKTPPEAPAAPDLPAGSRTGTQQETVIECPHCGWDLKTPDPVQITKDDKYRYIEAAAGGLPFQRIYKIFGGRMQAVFRELAPAEVDEVYKHCWHLRSKGEISTPQEFFELTMRLRLCLQLAELTSDEAAHRFPPNLAGWGGKMKEGDVTMLPQIRTQVYAIAIKTESLNHILVKALSHFNRLLSKLEDNWYRSDFWERTEQAGL